MKKLRIGTYDFKEMLDENGYFVDKSLLIREVIDGAKCLLLPRPRRFGKTLNMSMLRYFFEKNEEDTSRLFEGLAISSDADAMSRQGIYPVVSLSLKDITGDTWEGARQQLVDRISALYLEFEEVSEQLPTLQAEIFRRLCDGSGSDSDLRSSLANLVSALYGFHGQPVVVLVDEYDTPVIEAWHKGYYDEIVDFMRSWLGGALKHENGLAVYRAVVTGILRNVSGAPLRAGTSLRVSKESLFSSLNNLAAWTTLKPGPFADKFGFTQPEVDKMITDFSVPELSESIREWYNGYSFGDTTIYNPWSVVNCIAQQPMAHSSRTTRAMEPHWLNTGSNRLVHQQLEAGGLALKRDLEKLLSGEELRYPINESLVFADLPRSPQNVWSFLYSAGYLNADAPEVSPLSPTKVTYRLAIPNLEVAAAYEQFVDRIYDVADGCDIQQFLNCFLNGNSAEELQRTLQPLVLSLVSYHDVARQPEAVFHAFVLGLLANLRSVYEIRSNVETGYGRADIMMRPKTKQYPLGYVIEFKSISESENVDASLTSALEQIEDKAYIVQLREAGVADEYLRRLAIVLQGKRIFVRS